MAKYRKVFEDAHPRLDVLFETIRTRQPEALELMYGPELGRPLHILSDAARGFLWAEPGFELIDADYSSIEGRLAAWIVGEDWKLDAFRALDRGEGYGMYELAASQIFNVPIDKVDRKTQRPAGKVADLSLGFQGGVGALARNARQNKFKLASVFGSVWESAPADRREDAEGRFEERIEKHDETAIKLGREGWIAGELIKVGWRSAHPMTCAAWKALDDAVYNAVLEPGSTHIVLGVKYRMAHGFLWCQLQSGRCLAYGRPKIQEVEAPWADKTLPVARRERKRSVTALGVDSQTEKWVRYPMYGGQEFNNVVQGNARDILVHGMASAEAAGYPIVLHTHDEMAAEMRAGDGSVEEFERIINKLPECYSTLPLTASGWCGKRYRKD